MKNSFNSYIQTPVVERTKRAYESLSVSEVEAELFPSMALQRSDVALVFGRGLMTGFLALEAANLYKQGLIKKIIVMGGVPVSQSKDTPGYKKLGIDSKLRRSGLPHPHRRETEAEWARRILTQHGIPNHAISFENKSKHTGMNVTEAIAHHNLGKARRAVIIGEFCHTRRLLETVRHFLPLGDASPAFTVHAVFMPGITRKNWHKSPPLVNGFVKPELQRLGFIPWTDADYLKQGFITAASPEIETRYYKSAKRRLRINYKS